jgi:hypothetical protein
MTFDTAPRPAKRKRIRRPAGASLSPRQMLHGICAKKAIYPCTHEDNDVEKPNSCWYNNALSESRLILKRKDM